MRIVGIIAEYNPFHSGHKYHLEQAKLVSGADFSVVVMSPDFVQRGEPAIFSKERRTKMALEAGADLVLELPVCYATGSAEYFAEGAAALLAGIGADALCFGCETPDLTLFLRAAEILCEEPQEYQETLRTLLAKGHSFPKARAEAFSAYLDSAEDVSTHILTEDFNAGASLSGFLSSPNNILGIEYCRALQKLHSPMEVFPIQRIGHGYHDTEISGEFSSATALRHRIKSDPLEAASSQILVTDDLLPYLNEKLLTGSGFEDILDISPDLSDRLIRLRYSCIGRSWDEIVALLRTKQMTEARIRRCLLHLVLGITGSQTEQFRQEGILSFARILGFRRESSVLLKEIKKRGTLPLLTKPAHASRLLNESGQKMLAQNFWASHLYRSICSLKYAAEFRSEYKNGPVIL